MDIKRNFIYNVILTLSTYVVNLILFPYITRVLGVEQFGVIGFIRQTVYFFTLFATLGIGIVGVREIAVCGDDIKRRTQVFSSLVTLSVITTLITSAVYVGAIFLIPKMHDNLPLMLIGLSQLIFNTLLFEWFFRGIEHFRYISLCSISIKIIYIISVLTFVHSSEDYIIYFALTSGTVVLNATVNIVYIRKWVGFSLVDIRIKNYISPLLRTGSYTIITSMYTTFNVIYLGIVNTDTEVGYYFAATKIYTIILGIYTAFTNVMFPRMSQLIAQHDNKSIKHNLDISFDILLMFAYPIIAFCIVMGPELITLLSGDGYEGAIVPMQIIIVLLLVVGICQIIVMQIVIPRNEDNTLLKASIMGACVGIVCNIIFVKELGAIGSAIVLLVSEFSVFAFYATYLHKSHMFDIPYRKIVKQAAVGIPYVIICLGCSMADVHIVWRLATAAVLCIGYFVVLHLFILKTPVAYRLIGIER